MKAQAQTSVAPILLIEDEPSVTAFLRAALERHGYAVANAASGAEGLNMLSGGKYFGVISDIVFNLRFDFPVTRTKEGDHRFIARCSRRLPQARSR